jgi:hypothetical protein
VDADSTESSPCRAAELPSCRSDDIIGKPRRKISALFGKRRPNLKRKEDQAYSGKGWTVEVQGPAAGPDAAAKYNPPGPALWIWLASPFTTKLWPSLSEFFFCCFLSAT